MGIFDPEYVTKVFNDIYKRTFGVEVKMIPKPEEELTEEALRREAENMEERLSKLERAVK